MEFVALPEDESAVRRYVEELWVSYNEELAETVASHALAMEGEALVEAETAFRLGRLGEESYVLWVAVDGVSRADVDIGGGDGDLVGFVATEVDESPTVFDWPDRLVVGDLYVEPSRRGSGLADALLDRAAERARAEGCEQVALDVDVDNDRALAFYDRLGFEAHRHRMVVDTPEL